MTESARNARWARRTEAEPRHATMTVARARQIARRERCERLEALLRETGGNVAEMARRLGKDRSTVRYHLGRCGLLEEPPANSD